MSPRKKAVKEVEKEAPLKPRRTIESRHLARELALKVLFQAEASRNTLEDIQRDFLEHQSAGGRSREFALSLASGTLEHVAEIDAEIGLVLEHWSLPRLSLIDRNILRMAIYELLYCPDVPPKVTINEAIELGKRYGTDESGGFINGVLDKVLSSNASVAEKARTKPAE